MENEPKKTVDSLGQENPAEDLQRKTIEETEKRQKEAEVDAEKSSESEGA